MEQQPIAVPIRFTGAEEVPIQHANHVFVTHTEDEFFLTFAQAHPPYLLEMSAEEVEQLRKSGLPARVVARLAVSPIKMKEIVDVLSQNYNKFLARKGG